MYLSGTTYVILMVVLMVLILLTYVISDPKIERHFPKPKVKSKLCNIFIPFVSNRKSRWYTDDNTVFILHFAILMSLWNARNVLIYFFMLHLFFGSDILRPAVHCNVQDKYFSLCSTFIASFRFSDLSKVSSDKSVSIHDAILLAIETAVISLE